MCKAASARRASTCEACFHVCTPGGVMSRTTCACPQVDCEVGVAGRPRMCLATSWPGWALPWQARAHSVHLRPPLLLNHSAPASQAAQGTGRPLAYPPDAPRDRPTTQLAARHCPPATRRLATCAHAHGGACRSPTHSEQTKFCADAVSALLPPRLRRGEVRQGLATRAALATPGGLQSWLLRSPIRARCMARPSRSHLK